MKATLLFLHILFFSLNLTSKEYHVAKTGQDTNKGTEDAPYLTIQAAANVAQPGDNIIVHAGIYREHIDPPRGGISESKRITYRAAKGEKVNIKGSEIIDNWEKFTDSAWKATIPNVFFGEYNPYKDIVHGDWFKDLGRIHHTGEVYLNSKSLWESAILENVLFPKPQTNRSDTEGSTYTWYCETDEDNTYIYANFHDKDPNKEMVEINVRKSCFYPKKTGINFITVSGFTMSQAATQWAPPTAEQSGLIGTNWSKGWIIENNFISDSKCSGITLGKYGDEWDNTSANSAEGYVRTIERALQNGWNKETIGSHIVRNNTISNCEQTGICGSLGGIFSAIENNTIFNIYTKRQWAGAEIAGIKIHGAIDMIIKNNRLKNCARGIWLDWMAQGTRVTANLLCDNTSDDLFVEVNHGPFLIDNNIFMSKLSLRDWSEGGAYVHNLFAGNIEVKPQTRLTPYLKPHSTEVAGLQKTVCGDNRFYNNILAGVIQKNGAKLSGLENYEKVELPMYVNGNLYINCSHPSTNEKNYLLIETGSEIHITEKGSKIFLNIDLNKTFTDKINTELINSYNLGKAAVPSQGFENPDGTPLNIDLDFFGRKRDQGNPMPGPVEKVLPGLNKINIAP
jgi:hypothetical protein